MRHQEIVYNLTGQTFAYDPPEGRASGTPTVQVFDAGSDDDAPAESATTGACSVDAVSTTISVAADAGEVAMTVTSGTGVTKGRRYQLTDADGQRELVEVATVSGTAVTVRHPLVNSYASGADFEGTRISIGVNATWMATPGNLSDAFGADTGSSGSSGYRLRWAYTVDSVATIGVSYADLVRYQAKNLVSPLDVDRTFPGWIDRLPPDYREDQGAAIIDEAFHAVRMDALADAHVLRRLRDTQVLAELVRYRANLILVSANVMHNGVDIRALEAARQVYDQRYESLLREPKVTEDVGDGGGASGPATRLPAWVR